MDKEIREKYDNESAPFNGMVLSCSSRDDDYIPLDTLRTLTKLIIDFLSESHLIETVYKCYDWQQHDGYLTVKQIVPNSYLTYLTKDNETFYSERSEDTYVNIGLYDKKSRWYLRIHIIDESDLEDGQEKGGRIDISLSNEYIELLKDKATKSLNIKVEVNKPKEFFKRIFV